MPRWKRRRLGTRVMSRSKSVTEPASGASSPVIRLKSVVLPAPLGPMMSRRSPGSTTRLTPEVTRSPPNDLSRPRTASALSGRSSDHLPGPELGDLGRAISELGQVLLEAWVGQPVVLAHQLGPSAEHRFTDREGEDPAVPGAEQIRRRGRLTAIHGRDSIRLDRLLLDQGRVVEGDRGPEERALHLLPPLGLPARHERREGSE